MPKSCRHVTCLSERRISSASLLGAGTGWVCLTCFRDWDEKSKFTTHGRTKNHPLAWVVPAGHLHCVQCGDAVDVDSLNAKTKETTEACLRAITGLMARKGPPVKDSPKDLLLCEEPLPPETAPIMTGSSVTVPPGLHNLGNTCFMNSALQSLAAVTEFRSSGSDPLGSLGNALFDLLSSMRDPSLSSVTARKRKGITANAVNPSHFFDNLSNKYDFFERNEQQDSHDFLRLLFNALDDEHDGLVSQENKLTTPHRTVFGGSVTARVDCRKCQNKITKKEACLDLSLAMDPEIELEKSLESLSVSGNGKNIAALIEAWQRPQKLEEDNAFACESCFKKGVEGRTDEARKVVYSPATCRYSLDETPQCLIIHLQRFSISKTSGRRRKSSFGYGKDHRDIRLAPRLSIGESSFILVAMIVHEGTTADSGHYIAIVHRDDRWYRISDSSVSLISEAAAHSCRHAYIVFYRRTIQTE
ncbi:hypothetical protein PSACC_00498 [Paramicrosporidium saccamoebae]|uniref:Ubiquitin carboxyl-terminal hydrolase n=1 Tax=Paramicrosporidium saccamoebae TaxID=1246581 RepID=A0A2H9TPH7_9FUNG|nr:hypothetical protein PSACC_00498 [Paramicrosporidium saccamoebae]